MGSFDFVVRFASESDHFAQDDKITRWVETP